MLDGPVLSRADQKRFASGNRRRIDYGDRRVPEIAGAIRARSFSATSHVHSVGVQDDLSFADLKSGSRRDGYTLSRTC
jgi:hypothetical protein